MWTRSGVEVPGGTLKKNVTVDPERGKMVEMEMKEEEEMQIEGLEGLVGSYNDIYADLNSLHLRAKKFQRIGENNRCEGDLDDLREKINQLELRQSRVREGLKCELQREHFERKAGWRVSHLHGKLAVVGSLLKKSSKSECLEASIGVEVEALSFWLEEVEVLLPQVQWRLASRWTAQRRRSRLARLKMLGEEIESRGRGVSLMTTECQEAKGSPHIKQGNNLVDMLVEKASLLEGRWQAAWLTCLEWQCLLEQLGKGEKNRARKWEKLKYSIYSTSCKLPVCYRLSLSSLGTAVCF